MVLSEIGLRREKAWLCFVKVDDPTRAWNDQWVFNGSFPLYKHQNTFNAGSVLIQTANWVSELLKQEDQACCCSKSKIRPSLHCIFRSFFGLDLELGRSSCSDSETDSLIIWDGFFVWGYISYSRSQERKEFMKTKWEESQKRRVEYERVDAGNERTRAFLWGLSIGSDLRVGREDRGERCSTKARERREERKGGDRPTRFLSCLSVRSTSFHFTSRERNASMLSTYTAADHAKRKEKKNNQKKKRGIRNPPKDR